MFSTARRRKVAAAGGALTLCTLAACSAGSPPPAKPTSSTGPERIVSASKNLRAAAQPQPNGTIWTLAGDDLTRALFEFSLSGGGRKPIGAKPVSNAAQSIAESLSGVIGVALAHGKAGALELLNGDTGSVTKTIPIGAPARQVVVGADENTFYVLNGTATSASVTVVASQKGKTLGTVPVPLDTVAIAPDLQQSTIYALQPSGTVSQVVVAGGRILRKFRTGDAARSIALSPDGSALYVLKGPMTAPNVAVVDTSTQITRRVLPAPANCLQILVSPSGSELYQMVGTPAYGNIQVFAS